MNKRKVSFLSVLKLKKWFNSDINCNIYIRLKIKPNSVRIRF